MRARVNLTSGALRETFIAALPLTTPAANSRALGEGNAAGQ